MSWLDEMRIEHDRSLETMRAEYAQLRADARADFDCVIARIEASEARLNQRMDDRFAKVDERLAGLQVAIADSKAELMKWMLVFWVGAVGAIAALAGVLRT